MSKPQGMGRAAGMGPGSARATGRAGRPSRTYHAFRRTDGGKGAAVAAVLLLVGSIAASDTHGFGVGFFAVVPDFNLGGSLAFYDLVPPVGIDGSVFGWWDDTDDGARRSKVGAGLALNIKLVDNLYPAVGVTVAGAQTKRVVLFELPEDDCPVEHGEPHCPTFLVTEIDHEPTRWGIEVKATYFMLDGWLGLTAGYRLTFDDPLEHQALFGASVVLQSVRQEAGNEP